MELDILNNPLSTTVVYDSTSNLSSVESANILEDTSSPIVTDLLGIDEAWTNNSSHIASDSVKILFNL